MIKEEVLVSVIIPVYNGEIFLADAINSIIKQDYHPLEIIIIDDGSTDKTQEVASQFKDFIQYFYQENAGPSSARNRGINIAKGDLITFLDADDLWVEGSLKKQIDYLKNNSQVQIVQGHLQNLSEEIDPQSNNIIKKFGKPRVSFNVGSAVYRKSVFEKIGLFNENLYHSEDVELLVRIKENKINWVVIDSVFLLYRRHQKSLTAQYNQNKLSNLHTKSWLKILKNNLDKRRKQS